jgi:hypothetical protein
MKVNNLVDVLSSIETLTQDDVDLMVVILNGLGKNYNQFLNVSCSLKNIFQLSKFDNPFHK